MIANRQDLCQRCRLTIRVGDPIRPNMVIRGFDGGKPTWARGQGYVHARCPKVDAKTGEIR